MGRLPGIALGRRLTKPAHCRSVWTLKKHYPKVKVYTRAYDVDHGLSLEKVSLQHRLSAAGC